MRRNLANMLPVRCGNIWYGVRPGPQTLCAGVTLAILALAGFSSLSVFLQTRRQEGEQKTEGYSAMTQEGMSEEVTSQGTATEVVARTAGS